MRRDSIAGKFLRNDLSTLVLRLAVLYVAWGLCRIVFYLQNAEAIGPVAWNELPSLLRGATAFDTVSIFYVNALFIALSLLPLRVREKGWYQKSLMWLFCVTNAAALVVNIADGVYFHYADKRFTSDELSYIGNNDNNIEIILKSVGENWYILLWGVALIWGVVWCYRRIKYHPTRVRGWWQYLLVNLVIFVLGAGAVVVGIRGGIDRQTRPITLSNATAYTTSNLKANLILSNPFCMIRTLGNKTVHYEKFFDQATLDSLYTPYHYPDGGEPNLGERNVMIFILESFSAEHSALLNPDLYPDGVGFTPFLDSLMREGYYFTNAYANGHKSIEAMPSILSSIPSYQTPFVLMPQALSRMEAMPWILAQRGYRTSFFNGSSRGSMGFGAYGSMIGIERYYSREDYESVHGKEDFDGYWGIWDMPFLQYMQEELSKMQQPFFTSVFTLTSHHPFVVPDEYKSLPEGRTRIHRGIQYTDLSLRRFMEAASGRSWYRNTLFVFVADHVSSETFASKTLTPTGGTHIIMSLYTPDGALKGRDESITQQMDIMPTVLGLVGNERPYFAFGRDVLRDSLSRPMATNVVNENFQAITDSLVLYFDGQRVLSAYKMADTLQQHDISGEPSEYLDSAERDLKARLQQYYQHVEASDYIVK